MDSEIPDLATVRAKVVARFERSLGCAVMAKNLDTCLWNWTLRTCQRDRIPLYWTDKKLRFRYTTKALSLDFNLRHPKNPGLVLRVKDKTVTLKQLVNLTPYQMFPELWDPVFERVARRQLRRMTGTLDAAVAPDGAFQCNKCKSKKTVYYSLQTRAADEPMTNFVTCLNCGKNWKD